MVTVSVNHTNDKPVNDQLQSRSQRHIEAISPRRSRSEDKEDLASAADIHAHRRPALVSRLHIEKQQPTPRRYQRRLITESNTTKQTITTGTSDEVARRRQWSQIMLDALQDLSLVLSPDSSILWAPRTAKAQFVRHLQESIDQQADFYHYYNIRKADGDYSCFEFSGRPHIEVMDPVSGCRIYMCPKVKVS